MTSIIKTESEAVSFGVWTISTIVVSTTMVLYHLASTQTILLPDTEHQGLHLVFSLALVLLVELSRRRLGLSLLLSTIVISAGLAGATYVLFNIEHLQNSLGFPEQIDVLVGLILMLAVLEATRRSWGVILPLVAVVFIGYFFFGHYLSGPLNHRHFDIEYVVSYLSIGLTGIYGTFLSISANQIFLFVVFGSMFKILGIDDFLNEVGKVVGRRLRSGPAQTAVVSSSLVGMITGASVANVVVTGSFTIPYMKRLGYSRELAGAVEATASTGGQLMPPVMGAAAFLMAFFIGVPYADVMLAGIIPALLFYIGVLASVHFASVRDGIFAPTERPDYRIIARRAPAFLLPLAIIIYCLLNSYSPDVAAFWAIVAATIMAFLRSDRPSITDFLGCLADGAIIGARIALSLAVVGMIAQTLISTGLGAKLAGLIETFSDGNVILALLLTMVVAIILGCGVPPAAAYSLTAIVAGPTLVRMGLPEMPAHFFIFYFAIISAVTPPVALGALAACALSGGDYFKTSVQGFLLALSGFIVPFFVVFNSVTYLEVTRVDLAVGSLIAMPIALITLSALVYGHALRRLSAFEYLLAALAAAGSFGFVVFSNIEHLPLEFALLATSICAFGLLCYKQHRGS